MSWLKTSVPLVLFIGLSVVLWQGLSLDPREIPSPMINKSVPEFDLPGLGETGLKKQDLKGQVSLLNVFASWCAACRYDHVVLQQITEQDHISIFGLNYKDSPADARLWLQKLGNPYKKIGVDIEGRVAIDFGVYGTPQTFVIDKKGRIRYKRVGIMELSLWKEKVLPLVRKLQNETS